MIKKLPPLLPVEYCSIARASRMLECEIEDILHWGSIGYIELCCLLDNFLALVYFCDKDKFEPTKISYVRQTNHTPLTTVIINSSDFDEEYTHYESILFGCWPLSLRDIQLIEVNGSVNQNSSIFRSVNAQGKAAVCESSQYYEIENLIFTTNDLWITYPNLEKIHNLLTKDVKLSNIYNDVDLAQNVQNYTQQPTTRVTVKQADMIKALIQVHPDLNEHIANPHTLFTKLEQLFTRNGIQCPVSDSNTIANWLNKAR